MSGHRFFLVVSILFLNACATYEPVTHSISPPSLSESKIAEQDGLQVQASPISNEQQQDSYFDANLNELGFVPIHLTTENKTLKSFVVGPTEVRLRLSDGHILQPIDPEVVGSLVTENGNVVGATLAFGFLGLIAATQAEKTAKSQRIIDYQNKAFKEIVLQKDDSSRGVLFFSLPAGSPKTQGDLHVNFVDDESAEKETLIVPISLEGVKPTKIAASEITSQTASNSDQAPTVPVSDYTGSWVAIGATWTVEMDINGDLFSATALCRENSRKFSGNGGLDTQGQVTTVKLLPLNKWTPNFSGTMQNMKLYANGWPCFGDELRFKKIG